MDNYSIVDLCSRPEDQWFDRKSSSIAPKDLARHLVAFANAEGGMLAVGITNDDKVEEKLTAKRENDLRVAAHNHTDPAVRLRIEKLDTVLLFHVEPGERVHFTKNGDCYLRLGDKSVKLSVDQQQELRDSKGEQLYDATGLPGTGSDDLDLEAVAGFARRIGSSSPENASELVV